MKNFILFSFVAYLLLLNCCQSVRPLSGCTVSPTEKVLRNYLNATGTVRQDPSSKLFYLQTNKCDCKQIRPTPKGLNVPTLPCKLPDKYKKDGLAIPE